MSDFALVDGNLVIDGDKLVESKAYEVIIESSEYADSVFTTNELLSEKTYGGDGFKNSYYHTENIVFESNDWIDGVTEIKVTPDGGSAYTIDLSMISKLVKDSDTIINGLAIKNPGNNTIEVKSEGYEVYSKTVMFHNPKMAPEGVKLSESNTLSTKEAIVITTPNVFAPSYTVYEVQVDGVKLTSDQFTVDSSNVVINAGTATEGQHEITLKANGYQDKLISVNIVDSGVELDPEGSNTPNLSHDGDIFKGDKTILKFVDKDNWSDNVSEIVVNGNAVNSFNYTVRDNEIELNTWVALNTGENTITVKSAGFDDVTYTVNALVKLPSFDVEGYKYVGYPVSLSKTTYDFKNWISAVESSGRVLLDSQEVLKASIEFKDYEMVLPASLITNSGEKTITIEAPNYKTMTTSVSIAEVPNHEPAQLTVEASHFTGSNVSMLSNSSKVEFDEWVESDLVIKVNNGTLSDSQYSTSSYPSTLHIKPEAFDELGQHDISIEAVGYKNLTFSIELVNKDAGTLLIEGGTTKDLEEDIEIIEQGNSSEFGSFMTKGLIVSINGSVVDSYYISKNVYGYFNPRHIKIDSSQFPLAGEYIIELSATGYETETLNVTIDSPAVSSTSGGAITVE